MKNIKTNTSNLSTICDFIRYAVSTFTEAKLSYGHGTSNAFDEAAFLVTETLHLPHDTPLEPFWNAHLTNSERKSLTNIIQKRVSSRKPASYLVNKAYMHGIPFYVDENVIVPRSFIGDLICAKGGLALLSKSPEEIETVLDLCTGSGCLAILAAKAFPNAKIDATELSPKALKVAQRNVKEHGLEDRITLLKGDLFKPVANRQYDLILANPPYVDAAGMAKLPPEYKHEPAMALAGGRDGLDAIRRIIKAAPAHLTPDGGLLCEVGRCQEAIVQEWPQLPFIWLDTENSEGEVFWISAEDLMR